MPFRSSAASDCRTSLLVWFTSRPSVSEAVGVTVTYRVEDPKEAVGSARLTAIRLLLSKVVVDGPDDL